MRIARFNTNGNHRSRHLEKVLDGLLDSLDGVVDWAVGSHGEVAIEFDPDYVDGELIEMALSDLGLQMCNRNDDLALTDFSVQIYLGVRER